MFYAAGRDLMNTFIIGMGSVKAGDTIKGLVELTKYSNEMTTNARKRYCLVNDQYGMQIKLNTTRDLIENQNDLAIYRECANVMGCELKAEVIFGYDRVMNVITPLVKAIFGLCGAEVPDIF